MGEGQRAPVLDYERREPPEPQLPWYRQRGAAPLAIAGVLLVAGWALVIAQGEGPSKPWQGVGAVACILAALFAAGGAAWRGNALGTRNIHRFLRLAMVGSACIILPCALILIAIFGERQQETGLPWSLALVPVGIGFWIAAPKAG